MKNQLTKQLLQENLVSVIFDADGQPCIKQKYIQTSKRNSSKKWKEDRKISTAVTSHPYGTDKSYPIVYLKIDGKMHTFVVSNVVWVYFNDSIPEGYDVDHIDDDSFNNRLDNLQLLTRTDNIRKRGKGCNQYTENKKIS